MTSSSIKLGRIAGVDIGINISVLFIAALIAYSLAASILPSRVPGADNNLYIIAALVASAAFFASILVHELAHALAARFYGFNVQEIVLFIFGGITVIDEDAKTAGQEFWIAIVGPISSAAVGVLSIAVYFLAGDNTLIGETGMWLGQINLALAAFNMLPGFPLDGGRVLRAIIWFASGSHLTATTWAVRVGQGFAAFFFIAGGILFFITTDVFLAFSFGFVGWFMWSAGVSHIRMVKVQSALRGISIDEVVSHRLKLDWNWSLMYALDMMSLHGARHTAPVMKDNELIGLFSMESVVRVPRFNWGTMRVGQVMQPATELPRISNQSDLLDTLRFMEQNETEYVIVEDDHEPSRWSVLGRHELLVYAERRRQARAQQVVN